MKQTMSWQHISRIKLRDVTLRRAIIALYMNTETVTISSRRQLNQSNFSVERLKLNRLP